MNTYLKRPERIRLSWMNFFWFILGLLLISGETFAQTYRISMNQRRLGNKIGVEFWVKDLTPNGAAPNLGNTTLAVKYNTDFLIPDGNIAYAGTDSVYYDMDYAQPYIAISSPYALTSNGYLALKAQPTDQTNGAEHVYVHTLDVNVATSGSGIKPSTSGRGTFIGMVKFNIKNFSSLTDNDLTKILFNTATFIGDMKVFDYAGNDVEAQTEFVNQGDFNIRGIKILNPNGPNQAVNRYPDPALKSLSPNKGYPVYFERSGLGSNAYGTSKYAYSIDYSLDNGASWLESGRVAETNLNATTMGANKDNYRSGEIDSLNSANNFFIAQGDGSALPSLSGDGYEGMIRLIWKANENFFARSEQAKLRIVQLDTITSNPAISARTPYSANGRKDVSDANFVLGRLFFVQLDGTSSYLKTQSPMPTPTQLTVEAWVNLNKINTEAGAEPGIVVSSAGPSSSQAQEGAWMLYLKDGKYPAFRARELEGKGPNGYLGVVVSPDSLKTTSSSTPITNAHASNWTHIAASVKDGVVTLYVNGEVVDQYTNTTSVSPRMWNTNHPIWIGVNPNVSIEQGDYLNAGIKEVKVWRTALDQNVLRSRIAGVYDANGAITALGSSASKSDERTTLDMYYTLQGSRLDVADNFTYQSNANPLDWYTNPSINAAANNSAINYRPDRSHIKLTAPIGGEGVCNLKDNSFKVRWAGYGLGKTNANTADVQVMISRDKGNTWFDAIDNQSPAYPLDRVEIESYEANWSPYNNITTSGQDDDLQGVVNIDGNYSKTVRLKISGTEARNQSDVYDISGDFTVAPYFAIKNTGSTKMQVKDGVSNLSLNGAINLMEAWIRPYRFPTNDEAFFPIMSKKLDDGSGKMQYALRLLPSGQLELAIASSTGEAVRTARSAAALPIIAPTVKEADSAWIHVAAYVNLANGGTASSVRFYIDGTPQFVDSISTQLGANVKVDPENAYPVFFGYEPTTTAGEGKYFIGEMREIRFWGGNPGNQAPSGQEPSALTKFIQGAATVRANEIGNYNGADYAANLVAAFSFNGGNFVPSGYVKTSKGYPTSSNWLVHMSGNGYSYAATRPTIKLVEPLLKQNVANTQSDLRVRWTGFDYNRNNAKTFRNGSDGANYADIEYSIKGGGGNTVQDWQSIACQKFSAAYTNAMTLPSTNSAFEFLGTSSKSQFGAQIDVSKADPDADNNFAYNDQGPLGAAQTNGAFQLRGRSTINGITLEYDNLSDGRVPSLKSISELFNITPPSNFTVRVLLEGHHAGRKMNNDVGTSLAEGGYKITLFKNNSGLPGARVDSAESENGYVGAATALDPTVAPVRGTDGSQYANVPFVFTNLPNGRYFVKIDNINHLPIISKYAAPFFFSGDDNATWAIESGWDFQSWDGVSNNVITENEASQNPPSVLGKYTAYGNSESNPSKSEYGTTGLVFNNGQLGATTGSDLIAAMVGGDVVKDGTIDAADRTMVVMYDGGSNIHGDVTGDGMVNATDRTIVYRNSGKGTSVNQSLTAYGKVADTRINPEVYALAPSLYDSFLKLEDQDFVANGYKTPINNTPFSTKDEALQAGLSYKVNAAPTINGEYIEVPMYITNTGGEFAMGNATFGIKYNPAQLQYVEMTRANDVIFNNRLDLGYLETFSAPNDKTIDPISDLRTIDVNYDFSSVVKPGQNVPYTSTYLGTLKFKVINLNEGVFLQWHPITVVHSTKGLDVTGNGVFEPIPAIVVNKVARITSPAGGEKWAAGKVYTIAWTAPTQKAMFNIEYSIDNGAVWNRISSTPVMSSDMSYNWVTPRINSTECLVRIINVENGVEIDRSDATFAINSAAAEITRPSSADPIYKGGASDYIQWTYDNTANVKFEFSENGNSWTEVSGVVNASDKKASWTIPAVNTKNAIVRMIDATTKEVIAQSSVFKVLAGTVTLTEPTAKSSINVGEKHDVRWNYDNVTRFDLQFSKDGGKTWTNEANDVVAMTKKFNWTVPNVNTNEGIIRAIYNGDESMEYSRTEAFKVGGIVNVEDANQMFSFEAPAPNPFTLSASFAINLPYDMNVNIFLFNSLGEKVAVIANDQALKAGVHQFNIDGADLPAGAYYIHVNAGQFNMTQQVIKTK
jgi:hypothetical protein